MDGVVASEPADEPDAGGPHRAGRRDGDGGALPEGDLRALARNLSQVLQAMHLLAAGDGRSELVERLRAHLGVDPAGLPVVSHEVPPYQLVDLHVALDRWVAAPGRSAEVVGVTGDQRRFHPLSELVTGARHFGLGLGPVDYVDLADSPDTTRSCVRFGLFLLRDGDRPSAALVRGPDPHGPIQQAMLEVLAPDRDDARQLVAELRQLAVDHSVIRGQVLMVGPGEGNRYGALRFVRRPVMDRAELVLPEATLAHIEGHVVGIASHAERLRAVGQHLKRGVLLYGPPGTGKTHTVRYLLSQRRDVTAFVLSGQALPMIGQVCGLARVLQPSMVVLEDVDLIAADRRMGPAGGNPLLFEVLNQIDGIGDDVDVTFLLTTNRVDVLERALAERPGRVDAAVEIGPPDADGRRRLFRLYGAGVGVDRMTDDQLSGAIDATDGRTATYLREVVRRAALIVAEAGPGPLVVDGDSLERAATELLDDRAALTRSLLGGVGEPDAEPPLPPFPAGARPMLGGAVLRSGHGPAWGHVGGSGPPPPFAPPAGPPPVDLA